MVRRDIRHIVCEGTCNPTLAEYDQAIERLNGGNWAEVLWFVRQESRKLVHTAHIKVRNVFWDPHAGWTSEWKCQECGTVRKY